MEIPRRFILRETRWSGATGVVQVACWVLENPGWEELCGSFREVGPFDDADQVAGALRHEMLTYAAPLWPEQLSLL